MLALHEREPASAPPRLGAPAGKRVFRVALPTTPGAPLEGLGGRVRAARARPPMPSLGAPAPPREPRGAQEPALHEREPTSAPSHALPGAPPPLRELRGRPRRACVLARGNQRARPPKPSLSAPEVGSRTEGEQLGPGSRTVSQSSFFSRLSLLLSPAPSRAVPAADLRPPPSALLFRPARCRRSRGRRAGLDAQ